jgi:hypothetical protein
MYIHTVGIERGGSRVWVSESCVCVRERIGLELGSGNPTPPFSGNEGCNG